MQRLWTSLTARKVEEALQQSEQRQKAILDNIPTLLGSKTKKGSYLAVNAAWCSFLASTPRTSWEKRPVSSFQRKWLRKLEEKDRIDDAVSFSIALRGIADGQGWPQGLV